MSKFLSLKIMVCTGFFVLWGGATIAEPATITVRNDGTYSLRVEVTSNGSQLLATCSPQGDFKSLAFFIKRADFVQPLFQFRGPGFRESDDGVRFFPYLKMDISDLSGELFEFGTEVAAEYNEQDEHIRIMVGKLDGAESIDNIDKIMDLVTDSAFKLDITVLDDGGYVYWEFSDLIIPNGPDPVDQINANAVCNEF